MKGRWLLAATVCAMCAWVGCTSGNETSAARSATATPAPTPTPTAPTPTPPDDSACRDALNKATAACGAQFLTGTGVVIPQNDLLAACGQDKVTCVTSCWEADEDCGAFRSCLAERCALE